MHVRRSAVRLLFRTGRQLGLCTSDPTVDIVLPPRSSLRARPLTDDEVGLCRSASVHRWKRLACPPHGRSPRRPFGLVSSPPSTSPTSISSTPASGSPDQQERNLVGVSFRPGDAPNFAGDSQ